MQHTADGQQMVASFLYWAELQEKACSDKTTDSGSTELGSLLKNLKVKAGINRPPLC